MSRYIYQSIEKYKYEFCNTITDGEMKVFCAKKYNLLMSDKYRKIYKDYVVNSDSNSLHIPNNTKDNQRKPEADISKGRKQ